MPGTARDYRVNQRIRVPEVLVIDERGEQLGVLATPRALELAEERGLDLVEVAPNSAPPVCRLLDYGKFRYIQTTKEREARKTQKAVGLRQVRFRTRIGEHDLQAKERLMHKFLDAGAKVKVSVMFRGREITHPELGMNLLRKVVEKMKEKSKLEQAPSMEGRMMSLILAPLPNRQRPEKEAEQDKDMEHAEAQDA